mmetsp:Transcript_34544/g.39126  ORF Transcript_34544/g.39126 Transcript_34544/m.39126 type:complete len:194 (-) Transcript_34544:249-830(-)
MSTNLEGIWKSDDFYGPHGCERVEIKIVDEKIVATKVTGDPNVPAGKVTWKTEAILDVGGYPTPGSVQVRADTADDHGYTWIDAIIYAKSDSRIMVFVPACYSSGCFERLDTKALKDSLAPVDTSISRVSNEELCPLCHEEYSQANNDASLCMLGCEHVFHEKCLLDWLYINPTCPICRKSCKHAEESPEAGF